MKHDMEFFIRKAEVSVLIAVYERLKLYAPNKTLEYQESIKEIPFWNGIINSWDQLKQEDPDLTIMVKGAESLPIPLQSIFSHLRLFQNNRNEETYYEAIQWNGPVHYSSVSKPSLQDLQRYWGLISESFHKLIPSLQQSSSEVRLSKFLSWAETWLSSVAADSKNSSISLSDYLKTISALIIAKKNNGDLKIVLGDVSGIQSYLFDISHIGSGKVAKRLRARSFALGLLAESSAHQLLLDANVPIQNLLLSAGGLFYALIPSDTTIENWETNINEYLYHRFHGSINLNIAEKEIPVSELWGNFPSVLSKLHEELQIVKGQPFHHQLMNNEGWNETNFVHDTFKTNEPCNSCYKFPKLNLQDVCEYCQLDETIGQILPKTNYLIFKKGIYSNLRNKRTIDLGNNICVELVENVLEMDENTYFIQVWNQSPSLHMEIPSQRKWVANYIPVATKEDCANPILQDPDEELRMNTPLTFNQLSKFSNGKNLIGYFKADVDRLGMLFSVGLLNDKNDKLYSLMHVVTLSKQLERFFAGGINELLNTTYKRVYTVFSGGDDLFFIGPWSDIIEAAKEVRQQFESFVGLNKEVTLSAGISIVKPNMPIPHVSKEVETQLDMAKEIPNRIRQMKGDVLGRNQVALFDTVMTWEDFNRLNGEAIMIANWWKENKISSSFLYQLSNFSDMYHSFKNNNDTEYLKFVPLLSYSIYRNLEELPANKKDQGVINWAKQLLDIDNNRIDWLWGYLKIIIKLSTLYRLGDE